VNDNGESKRSDVGKSKTWQEELIEDVRTMTTKELFDVAVAAGIYTPDGKLTPLYQA
jgi:hypothetical protein